MGNETEYRLCYVDLPWLYFTTQPLSDQWGDDWNDVPYEHNAEVPYTGDGWEIVKIAVDTELVTPAFLMQNSPFSVEDINAGQVPWLRTWYSKEKHPVAIMAGTLLPEVVATIEKCGGNVYPRKD